MMKRWCRPRPLSTCWKWKAESWEELGKDVDFIWTAIYLGAPQARDVVRLCCTEPLLVYIWFDTSNTRCGLQLETGGWREWTWMRCLQNRVGQCKWLQWHPKQSIQRWISVYLPGWILGRELYFGTKVGRSSTRTWFQRHRVIQYLRERCCRRVCRTPDFFCEHL